jgi:hypothetical protein
MTEQEQKSVVIRSDSFEVGGLERAFRFANGFMAENVNGAAGLLEQCFIWAEAYSSLTPDEFDRFRQKVGHKPSPGLINLKEESLYRMSDKLWPIRSELGSDLGAWAILFLISRPQKGGIQALLDEYDSSRHLNAAALLERITLETLRRESQERFE